MDLFPRCILGPQQQKPFLCVFSFAISAIEEMPGKLPYNMTCNSKSIDLCFPLHTRAGFFADFVAQGACRASVMAMHFGRQDPAPWRMSAVSRAA